LLQQAKAIGEKIGDPRIIDAGSRGLDELGSE